MWGIRHLQKQCVSFLFSMRERVLAQAQLLLHPLQLLELLRRGLSLELGATAELVHLRHELAPAFVGGEQRIEGLDRTFARERRAEGFRIVARGPEVDHAREFRNDSITRATPSSSGPGQTQS